MRRYKDGRKKIQFDDFFGEIVIAYPDDLDGIHKSKYERMWKEEKDRIVRDNGWIQENMMSSKNYTDQERSFIYKASEISRSKEMFKKYNTLMNCSRKTMDFDKTY